MYWIIQYSWELWVHSMPSTMLGSENTDESIPAPTLRELTCRGDRHEDKVSEVPWCCDRCCERIEWKCVYLLGKCQAPGIPWLTNLTQSRPFWSLQRNEKEEFKRIITNEINLLQEGRGIIRRILWTHLRGDVPGRSLGWRNLDTWHCAETSGVEGEGWGDGGE